MMEKRKYYLPLLQRMKMDKTKRWRTNNSIKGRPKRLISIRRKKADLKIMMDSEWRCCYEWASITNHFFDSVRLRYDARWCCHTQRVLVAYVGFRTNFTSNETRQFGRERLVGHSTPCSNAWEANPFLELRPLRLKLLTTTEKIQERNEKLMVPSSFNSNKMELASFYPFPHHQH